MVAEEVTPEHIAAIVSRWTGIPVTKMLEGEREKLLHMEDELGRRVISQKEESKRYRTPFGVRVQVCKTLIAPWAHFCF